MRERFERENTKLRMAYSAALWAAERYFRRVNEDVSQQIHELRREIGKEFGAVSRLAANLAGPVLLWTTRREDRRLARGVTYGTANHPGAPQLDSGHGASINNRPS